MNWNEWDVQETTTKTETLLAVAGKDNYIFSGINLSPLFIFTMSENWPSRMYGPYYEDFWKPLHKALTGTLEVGIEAEYTFGVVPEKTLQGYMEEWREGRVNNRSNFLSVQRLEGQDEVAYCRFQILDIHTKVPGLE